MDERKAVRWHERLVEALKTAILGCDCPCGDCSSCRDAKELLRQIEADRG